MKKTALALLLGAAALCGAAKSTNDTVIVMKLQAETPMHCEKCEQRIRGDLRFEKGVRDIKTSVDKQTVTVRYDKRKNNPASLSKALSKLGYKTK